MGYYKMSFEAFNNLIEELTPFFQSQRVNLVQPQVVTIKIVAIVIYRLAHGTNATHMANQFNVGASTIRKYVDIVCDTLCDKNTLFNKYINIPSNDYLQKIIDCFHDLIGLLNICGAINGIHIPLTSFLNKKMTFAVSDFFNTKKNHTIVMQAICDANKKFQNVCVDQPGGIHDNGQFKMSNDYRQLRNREIL